MGFTFSEQHIEGFQTSGYTVFRSIMPPSLITDLRRITEQGREIARARDGRQTQRLQPIAEYGLDPKPLQDYRELAPLRDAVDRVLGPQFIYGDPRWLGVFLEPADLPYCMPWHRDARELLTDEEWAKYTADPEYGNQVNAPLYEDSCTWFVPGSDSRDDVPGEYEFRVSNGQMPPVPGIEGKTYEERERICLDYCESMPGAVQLHLNAGDFALYKPWGWHLGNYIPYRKRATLHDGVFTARSLDWIPFIKSK